MNTTTISTVATTALRTSINADLQLLNEEKLKAVSQYVKILVLNNDANVAVAPKETSRKGLRHSLDALRQLLKQCEKNDC